MQWKGVHGGTRSDFIANRLRGAVTRLQHLPMPVIAAIDGPALGMSPKSCVVVVRGMLTSGTRCPIVDMT